MAAATPTIHTPHVDYLSILPMLIMMGGALVLMAVSSLFRKILGVGTGTLVASAVSVAALVAALFQWDQVSTHGPQVTIAGAIAFDGFDVFIQIVVAIAMLLTALVGDGYLSREGIEGPEFHVLAMMSASGAMMMGAANDLIVIFLGLEIMSIALYVLAAFNHKRAESGEAALKYFVLGAFSSAIFVYGIALTYGATGSTNLPQIADYLSKNVVASNGVLLGGMALLLVGFGFKIAAVPFHMWSPDVYQGSPSPVTGFMAAVAKAGAFAALLRVFVSSFGTVRTDWQPIVWALAVLSLVLGAVVALIQRDVKRMMAYSSINHVGFILLGRGGGHRPRGVGLAVLRLHLHVPGHRVVRGDHRDGPATATPGTRSPTTGAWPDGNRCWPWPLPCSCSARPGSPSPPGSWPSSAWSGRRWPPTPTRWPPWPWSSAAVAAFFYLRVAVTMFSPVGPVGDVPAGQDGGTAADGRGEDADGPRPRSALGRRWPAGPADRWTRCPASRC